MPRKLGSKAKIAAYLIEHVGEIVRSKDLLEASGGAVQYSRRLRELRAEGWPIVSHKDRIDLKTDEYILLEVQLMPTGSSYRPINRRTRAEVLTRDGSTCQMCGAGIGNVDEQGRNIKLHIGHIAGRTLGGSNKPENLRTLCSACNEGARNLTAEPPSYLWLLGQIRNAKIGDQEEILKWLKKKYEPNY